MAIPIGEYEPFWLDTAGGKGILFLGDYPVPTGCSKRIHWTNVYHSLEMEHCSVMFKFEL